MSNNKVLSTKSIRSGYVKQIAAVCNKYSTIFDSVTLFGSVARGDDTEKSDIDLYIYSSSQSKASLLKNKLYSEFKLACLSITGVTETDIDFIIADKSDSKTWKESKLYKQIKEEGFVIYDKRTKDI